MRNLTVLDPKLEMAEARTVPGMAHWAGSGPPMTTCRQCLFWDNGGADPGYYAQAGKHHGAIIPHTAASCKYFSLNTDVPSIVGKW